MANERLIPLAVLGASVAALGFALTAQYGFDLRPCDLCIYQRFPFALAGLLAVLVMVLPVSGRAKVWMITLCGLAFLVNSGIAAYHVGVEQHWWTASCSAEVVTDFTLEQMMADLERPAERPPCDQGSGTLLGMSIPSWNVPVSFFLGVAALIGARSLRRV